MAPPPRALRPCRRGFLRVARQVSFVGLPAAASFGAFGAGITSGSTFGTWISTPAANVIPGFNCCRSAGDAWKRSASASSSELYPRCESFPFSTMSSGIGSKGPAASSAVTRYLVSGSPAGAPAWLPCF